MKKMFSTWKKLDYSSALYTKEIERHRPFDVQKISKVT